MKKKLILFICLLCTEFVFSQENIGSDISIYKDINQAYENNYYPGLIEKVDLLQKNYPDSVFLQSALVYKATALVNLECYDDAITTLEQAISHMHTGKEEFTKCHYLLGKSYFYLKKYEDALKSFYLACNLSSIDKSEKKSKYYDYSLYYSGESFFILKEYEKAYPLYEYVIEHGTHYSKDIYEKATINLVKCYKEMEECNKAISLGKKIVNDDIDYAKILFILEKYDDAYEIAKDSNCIEKDYICGLCKINLKDYENAKNHFIEYIKQNSNSEKFDDLAIFYKGYSEYFLKEYKNAYNSFVRFASEAKDENLQFIKKSYYYGALCAYENEDYKNVLIQTKNLIKICEDDEKIKAVEFSAELLIKCKKYDEAISILKPYTYSTSKYKDFIPTALLTLGTLYENKNDLVNAENVYLRLLKEYGNSNFGEEILFKLGIIYYKSKEYSKSYGVLNEYLDKYKSGLFVEDSLFYLGECALKVGEIEKSLLINNNFIKKYPDSFYLYDAYKNLFYSYYEKADFEKALELSNFLKENYKERYFNDSIYKKVQELHVMLKGSDRRILDKIEEFEKAGGIETKEGRIIGSEIVRLYGENQETQKYGFELAVQILEKQQDDEVSFAADNAEFAGDYLISIGENLQAGNYYLKAGEYFGRAGKEMKAASVLYGAAEAYSAAGHKTDALKAAALLTTLYPDTKYAERVPRVVR